MPTVQEILRRVGVPRERGVTDPTEQTETINEIIKCLTALRDTTEPRPMPTPFERRVDAAASRTFGLPVGLTPGQGELLNSPMTAVKAQGNLNPTTNIVSVKLSTDWLGTGVVGNAFNVYLLPSLWGDWNVTTGNILGVMNGNATNPSIGIWPGVDARVGTVKMWSLGADYVPQGWRLLPAGLVGAFPRYSSYDGILVPEVEIPSHDHSWGPLAYDTWSWQDIVGEPGTAVLKSIREDVMPGDFNGTTSSTELDYFPPHFGILFIERYHVGT